MSRLNRLLEHSDSYYSIDNPPVFNARNEYYTAYLVNSFRQDALQNSLLDRINNYFSVCPEAPQTVSFNRTNTHVENTNENRLSNSRDCILPEQPEGGHYELIGCAESCSKLPNDLVPEISVLSYTCKHNYILSGNTFSICINQKWTTPPSCLSKFISTMYIFESIKSRMQ